MLRTLLIFGLIAMAAGASPSPPSAMAAPAPAMGSRWIEGEGIQELGNNVESAKTRAHQKAMYQAMRKAYGDYVGVNKVDMEFVTNEGRTDVFEEAFFSETRALCIDEQITYQSLDKVKDAAGNMVTAAVCRGRFLFAQQPATSTSLFVKLTLNRKVYEAGDSLTFTVQANENASLMVFNIAANRRVYLVYPNQFVHSLPIKAGQPLQLPDPQDPFELKPAPLKGHDTDEESLVAIALRRAVEPPKMGPDGSISYKEYQQWRSRMLPPGFWRDAYQKYEVRAAHRTR